MPLSETNDYAEQIFAQQISQIPGVAQVSIFGQQKYAVRIEADPDAAAARGLTLNDVRNAVAAANSNSPIGSLRGQTRDAVLTATGQIERAEGYRDLVVAWRNGSPVRLSEIANVYDSVENDRTAAWFGDERAIVLAVFRQSDANTVAVVDAIRDRLPDLPGAIAALHRSADHQRPLGLHPRIRPRRLFHAGALGRARDPRHLPLPQDVRGDDHPDAGAARVADRHLRVHVCVRLFDRQHIAAGHHARRGLRRRRRHRHARKHHAPHRGRA